MLVQDARYAFRQLRWAPGFAATVALTLALSVGVATAVFCVLNTVLLQPLPFRDPAKIVEVQSTSRSGYSQPASWPSFKDERAEAHAFSALAAYSAIFEEVTLKTPSTGPVSLLTVSTTDNFFRVFEVQPLLGRTFLPGEETDGKNDIVVLSYQAWQRYFNGDRNIVNHAVTLNGRTYTVVGVMPAGFRFPFNLQNAIYTPRLITAEWMSERGDHWLHSIARLKDGVTIEQAQADLTHVFSNIGKAYPDTDAGRTVRLVPLSLAITSGVRGPLWTLLAAVLAVLAIGCVNVAGLLMARGVKREREFAVRTAMGAGRARLVQQLLSEGLLLALLGAAGGVLLAASLLETMRAFLIKALARGADVQMNWTALAVAAGIAIVVSLAAALFPALRLSGLDPNRAFKSGQSAGTGRAQHRLRAGFVVAQVALTLVLLAVSGLLLRSLSQYFHADLGFDPTHLLTMQINLSPIRYQNRDIVADFYDPLLERVRQIPGIRAAGIITLLPIQAWGNNSDIHIAGQPPYPPSQEMLAENRIVSRGYFDAFGIPLLKGRMLSPGLDRASNLASTVVVNEAFVKKFIPAGLDPTVQRIDDNNDPKKWTQIVGVTGNVRQDIYEPPLAERDWLMDEIPLAMRSDMLRSSSLVVRFDGSAAAIAPALRKALQEVDPTAPFAAPSTMTEVISQTLVFERMEGWLFGSFAALALFLALVGLHGLVNHEVEQATRDIGVRMALGATRNGILTMTLLRVAWMLSCGVAAGLVLTIAARKLIGVVIYFDARKEAGGIVLLGLLLIAAGLLAALLPALRAASIEPMQALRRE